PPGLRTTTFLLLDYRNTSFPWSLIGLAGAPSPMLESDRVAQSSKHGRSVLHHREVEGRLALGVYLRDIVLEGSLSDVPCVVLTHACPINAQSLPQEPSEDSRTRKGRLDQQIAIKPGARTYHSTWLLL